MIDETQIYRIIREAVRQELTPLLMGLHVATNGDGTASAQRFSGETPIDKQRLLSPYGVTSRPPAGTGCLVGAIGGDPTHLSILSQFDANRPALDAEGDVALYGPEGQLIYLGTDGEIHQGSKAAASPVVLGDVMIAALQALVNAFLNASPGIAVTGSGPGTLDPSVRSALTDFVSTYLTTASTNIVGQKNFVQRS